MDESPVEDDAGVGRGEVDAHAAGLGGEEHDEGAGARLVVVVDRRLGVKGTVRWNESIRRSLRFD